MQSLRWDEEMLQENRIVNSIKLV